MRITTKGRFAVIAMIDLACNEAGTAVPLADISERQDISLSYLEQLFARLRKEGLVIGTRGPGGGYRLAKSVEDISVIDIIDAVDDHVDARGCGGQENCGKNGAKCLAHNVWMETTNTVRQHLRSVSLKDAIRKAAEPSPVPDQKVVKIIKG